VIRSFLAFELPDEIKETVFSIYRKFKRSGLDVKWVKEENIHLTVIFMGNVAEKDIEPMGKAIEKACKKYGTFRIKVKGTGVFSSLKDPRVLWIGVKGDVERLSFFRDRLQKELKKFGIKEETRAFIPHITIGRFRKGFSEKEKLKNLLTEFKEVESPEADLKELILFKSELRPEGARYTKLNSWPLLGKK